MRPMAQRVRKQMIVGFATIVALLGIGFGIFALFQNEDPVYPTPYPTPVVDTGPDVENLEVVFSDFFEVRKFTNYDAVAYIVNPNLEYGASDFRYEFVFEDQNGGILLTTSGNAWVLPRGSRYVIRSALEMRGTPARVNFRVTEVEWQRLGPLPSSGLSINEERIERDEEAKITKFSGVAQNKTPYNLKNIQAQVVFYDPSEQASSEPGLDDPRRQGLPVATGETNMQDLLRGTGRFFQVVVPYVLPANLNYTAVLETNFFENSNFLREFGRQEKFKEYYDE